MSLATPADSIEADAHEALTLFDPDPSEYRFRHCRVCGAWRAFTPKGHRGRREPAPLYTYVMQRQGWVKVGKSIHPEVRLKELRAINRQCYIITPDAMDCTEPLLLLHVFDGDTEHDLHERFAAEHVTGEWFMPIADMRDWLATL